MNNLTIKVRLYLILVCAIGGFLVFETISFYQLSGIQQQIQTDMQDVQRGLKHLSQIQAANVSFKTQVQEWKNILIRGNDTDSFNKYLKGFDEAENTVKQTLSTIVAEMTQDNSALASEFTLLLNKHNEMGQKYRTALNQFDKEDMESGKKIDKLVKGMDRATTEDITRLANDFEQGEFKHISRQIEIMDARFSQIRNAQLIVFGILLCFFGGVIFISAKQINRQMSEFHETMLRIGQNRDLTLKLKVTGEDEISIIGSRFNELLRGIQEAILQMNTGADSVSKYAFRMLDSVSSLSTCVDTQTDATTDMAAAVEEMTASISHISNSSREANAISSESSKLASDGNLVIEKTISAMESTSQGVQETARVVSQVGQQSTEITGIVQIIKDVADQTNLLALNAAIEAARAGEQGRGFAVVADEVRKLAEKTTKLTQDITQLVSRIHSSSRDAISNMEKVVDGVNGNLVWVKQAGTAISGIRSGSKQVVEATENIAVALREQTAVSENIAQTVTRIERMSDENNRSLLRIKETASQMDQLANEMHAMVTRFKV
ncbi:methyl-accepting chemotaxis protein [Methylomonas sp. 2BW1-5-20]|uniref:methyl-accepting chemotaxis protein n=1 Tax=Methylomonas sp. 2BW1-5-20 TaxID=3376686 RepID=UPI00404C2242